MPQIKRYAGTMLLAVALAGPLLAGGCAARVRVYDEYHTDYHYWDDGEVRAYHVWIGERHYDYREYKRLNREQQRDYWAWRHEHTGRY